MNSAGITADTEMDFCDSYSYLLEHLARIDKKLQLKLHQWEQGTPVVSNPDAKEELNQLPAWLQARLNTENSSETEPTRPSSRLGRLTNRFGLSDLERDILLLAMLPLIDTQYSWQFSRAQANSELRFPGISFTLDVLSDNLSERAEHEMCFFPQSPLRKHGLISVENMMENDRSGTMIKVDLSLYHYLIGHDYLPPLLDSSCKWLNVHNRAADLPSAFNQKLSKALTIHPDKPTPRVALKGSFGSGRSQAVTAAAAIQGMPTLCLNLELLPENNNDALNVIMTALREVQLHGGCLLLKSLPNFAKKRQFVYVLLGQKVQICRQPIVTLQDAAQPIVWLDDAPQLLLEMPVRTSQENKALLYSHVDSANLDDQVDLDALAARFHISPSTLCKTLQEAEMYRYHRDPVGRLSQSDLVRALKMKSQQNFGDLAQRIEPVRSFADLVVHDDLLQQLNEVLIAIRHRDHAIQHGFGKKLNYGLGISTLLYGPSGAGKTMAAEVLAGALNVDLIKIDLSTVVNKYVGETEKHIGRIFDLAAMDSGVLFFDEADALFGKRSEVKDAQDRHSNIEVSYLLQRLENHPGLVILSSNNLSHLDSAFIRRLTFIIRFTFPDVDARVKMWRRIWPNSIRVAKDVDFEHFASVAELTGANIRNIALMATWLATEEKAEEVGSEHIKHALQREMTKSGKIYRQ